MDFKHTQTAIRAVKIIPPARFWAKVRDTALGALFLGGAMWMATHGVDWKAYVGVAVLGGFLISRDLMTRAKDFGIGILRDVLNAVRGKNGG